MVAAEGGTYFLPRLVGYHRALEILLLGDRVPAQQLYQGDEKRGYCMILSPEKLV